MKQSVSSHLEFAKILLYFKCIFSWVADHKSHLFSVKVLPHLKYKEKNTQ